MDRDEVLGRIRKGRAAGPSGASAARSHRSNDKGRSVLGADDGEDAPGSWAGSRRAQTDTLVALIRQAVLEGRQQDALDTYVVLLHRWQHVPDTILRFGMHLLKSVSRATRAGSGAQSHSQPSQHQQRTIQRICTKLYEFLATYACAARREELQLELSLYLASEGMVTQAVQNLEQFLPLNPYNQNPLYHGYCGILEASVWRQELARGDASGARLTLAIKHLADACALDPQNESFLCEYVQLLEHADRHKAAREALERFYTLCPTTPNAIRYLYIYIRKHNSSLIGRQLRLLSELVLVDPCSDLLADFLGTFLEARVPSEATRHSTRASNNREVAQEDEEDDGAPPAKQARHSARSGPSISDFPPELEFSEDDEDASAAESGEEDDEPFPPFQDARGTARGSGKGRRRSTRGRDLSVEEHAEHVRLKGEILALDIALGHIERGGSRSLACWQQLSRVLHLVSTSLLPCFNPGAEELPMWASRMSWWQQCYFAALQPKVCDDDWEADLHRAACADHIFGFPNMFSAAFSGALGHAHMTAMKARLDMAQKALATRRQSSGDITAGMQGGSQSAPIRPATPPPNDNGAGQAGSWRSRTKGSADGGSSSDGDGEPNMLFPPSRKSWSQMAALDSDEEEEEEDEEEEEEDDTPGVGMTIDSVLGPADDQEEDTAASEDLGSRTSEDEEEEDSLSIGDLLGAPLSDHRESESESESESDGEVESESEREGGKSLPASPLAAPLSESESGSESDLD